MKVDLKKIVKAEIEVNNTERAILNEFANTLETLEDICNNENLCLDSFIGNYYSGIVEFVTEFADNAPEVIHNLIEWLEWN